jgi:hypothetical protein
MLKPALRQLPVHDVIDNIRAQVDTETASEERELVL